MGYTFLDQKGTFYLENPENTGALYFPIAGEQGIKGAVTPNLGGDLKTGQNTFILEPVSVENLHNNKSTRNFWCCMEGKGIWSATGASAEEKAAAFTDRQEKSTLEAGIMWHKMTRESKKYQLRSTITSFVPVCDYQVEVMHVEISNTGREAVSFVPAAAVPLYARSADNIRDHRHVTSLLHRIRTLDCGVTVEPTLTFDERGHQKNEITYFVCGTDGKGEKPEGFYSTVDNFIGEGGSFERPEAIVKNLPPMPAGTAIDGYEAMGGLRFHKVVLRPDESKTFIILIGLAGNREDIEAIVSAAGSQKKVMDMLEVTKNYWNQKLNVSYHTEDERFDNFMHWVNFQPMLRRIYGCSFLPHHDYGKGGRGWRDLWQDCLALLIMNPDGVREMLIDNYAGVRIDGSNATIIGSKQGEFIADRNNITRLWMDHGVWPLITTKFYIDQTGDIGVLLIENKYFKDRQTMRGTARDERWQEGDRTILKDKNGNPYSGTILEHLLLQNLTAFYEVGEHNHFRMRGADWNDALDMAEERGESVAFTAAYAGNLETLSQLLTYLKEGGMSKVSVLKEMTVLFADDERLYEDIDAKKKLLAEYGASCRHDVSGEKAELVIEEVIDGLHHKAEWIKKHIRESEWLDQGEEGWFNGYYDNNGRQVEGRFPSGVRMMLTGQVFTIMSGTATEEQIEQITAAADRYLYEEKAGGYRLNTNFNEIKTDLGRMFGFAYGHKENGAVFSHMTTMYANALYKRGFVKEGYKALHTLYRQAMNFDVSKIYPGIPEYFDGAGRGLYHYLTGAASWLMMTVITEMFGVKGQNGNLIFMPKLLEGQFDANNRAEISLTFANCKWHVIYINGERKEFDEYQVKEIRLNGRTVSSTNMAEAFADNVIPLAKIQELDTRMQQEVIVVLN